MTCDRLESARTARTADALAVFGVFLLFVSTIVSGQTEYLVGAQDELTVQVWGRPELSGKFMVDDAGALNLPLIERVQVAGQTLRQIEEALEKRLADGYLKNPQVTVTIDEYRSQYVFVQGEVRQPGRYPLTGTTTLLEVLTQAGSTTAEAGTHVLVLRAAEGTVSPARGIASPSAPLAQRIELFELQRGSQQNIPLRDGDTIVVPPGEKVYISGHVRSPGAYVIKKDTTLLQAVILAGGVTERGALNRVKVLRSVDGKQKSIGQAR
jgi:polysaccharide export outer membrane protein